MRNKFVQALLPPELHKSLKMLAIEKSMTIGKLVETAIKQLIEKEKLNGERKEIN